jgi:hypothetical protein
MRADRGDRQVTVSSRDAGNQLLPTRAGVYPQHPHSGDVRQLRDDALDFARTDFSASHVDKSRHPADQDQLTINGQPAQVSCQKSAGRE